MKGLIQGRRLRAREDFAMGLSAAKLDREQPSLARTWAASCGWSNEVKVAETLG